MLRKYRRNNKKEGSNAILEAFYVDGDNPSPAGDDSDSNELLLGMLRDLDEGLHVDVKDRPSSVHIKSDSHSTNVLTIDELARSGDESLWKSATVESSFDLGRLFNRRIGGVNTDMTATGMPNLFQFPASSSPSYLIVDSAGMRHWQTVFYSLVDDLLCARRSECTVLHPSLFLESTSQSSIVQSFYSTLTFFRSTQLQSGRDCVRCLIQQASTTFLRRLHSLGAIMCVLDDDLQNSSRQQHTKLQLRVNGSTASAYERHCKGRSVLLAGSVSANIAAHCVVEQLARSLQSPLGTVRIPLLFSRDEFPNSAKVWLRAHVVSTGTNKETDQPQSTRCEYLQSLLASGKRTDHRSTSREFEAVDSSDRSHLARRSVFRYRIDSETCISAQHIKYLLQSIAAVHTCSIHANNNSRESTPLAVPSLRPQPYQYLSSSFRNDNAASLRMHRYKYQSPMELVTAAAPTSSTEIVLPRQIASSSDDPDPEHQVTISLETLSIRRNLLYGAKSIDQTASKKWLWTKGTTAADTTVSKFLSDLETADPYMDLRRDDSEGSYRVTVCSPAELHWTHDDPTCVSLRNDAALVVDVRDICEQDLGLRSDEDLFSEELTPLKPYDAFVNNRIF